ncbi:RNA methyltransferase [Bermanella marisrubri]|uniref:tRNA (cytidine/uridine-2'-O-)-methyltransferase TrmJ n=1 Tax=Bermanella marisrubri TaxID=207949 RepID=Q1MYA0_9GAMM|nr:RNA methyltransferase [Bermanella marisrubri]EAT10967.1 rRNA methylase [Oceanobacter sp. RED65] [Bermanella marisrubri]QIZ85114.1 RNA methyltransferase [Bermanella marisrubri]
MLENLRIVLIGTSHNGNIGSTARAMKTMGINDLVLVEPKSFDPNNLCDDAIAMASGATDLLASAKVVSTFEQAIEDCAVVMGASARSRHLPWPLMHPRKAAAKSMEVLPRGQKVALVLGRERTGLTNDELAMCQVHIHIPANPDYASLNVAAAAQVLCYEVRMAALDHQQALEPEYEGDWGVSWDNELATQGEMNGFFQHLEETLVDIQFLDPNNPKQLMPRLRRLFQRAMPDKVEVNILRGILKMVLRNNKQ